MKNRTFSNHSKRSHRVLAIKSSKMTIIALDARKSNCSTCILANCVRNCPISWFLAAISRMKTFKRTWNDEKLLSMLREFQMYGLNNLKRQNESWYKMDKQNSRMRSILSTYRLVSPSCENSKFAEWLKLYHDWWKAKYLHIISFIATK